MGAWAPSRQLAAESQSHTGYVCLSEEARGRGAAGDQLATAEVGNREGGYVKNGKKIIIIYVNLREFIYVMSRDSG